MAKKCVTEKTAIRQRWIESGLQEMMLQKKYSDISVTDLCRHLQLSRRSFYRYFDDLDDVLNSLLDHTFENLVISPQEPTVEELERTLRFWVERKDLMDALYFGGVIEKLFDFSLRYTDFSKEEHPVQRDRQVFIIGGFMSLLISWYQDGFRKSSEEMAGISYQMLYEPFLKK